MKEWKQIPLDKLEMNRGQAKWLPRNPRQWTQEQLDRLKESIRETPLLLEARGLIVFPAKGGKYIVIGGNMRLAALEELGAAEAPCYVLPAKMTPEKVKEIAIKDNGSFGEWDAEALMEEWKDFDLDEFGVVRWNPENAVTGGTPAQDGNDAQPAETKPEIDPATLPAELQGIDLTPEGIENLVGDDEVARDRIIISFTEDDRWRLEEAFGVRDITSRVLWRLEDIMKLREEKDGNA